MLVLDIIIFRMMINFDVYNSNINYFRLENDILFILPQNQYHYLLINTSNYNHKVLNIIKY